MTDARALYDADYAAVYDGDFQEGPIWSIEAGHYVRSLTPLMRPGVEWLDVGCGTGWFLSQFPDVDRAGLDYSPAMLEKARGANPTARFFVEGDAREDVTEWHDRWSLVTCTGQPYSYFRTIDEVEALAENLSNWTAPGGTCFVQVCDLLDLTGHRLNYDFEREIPEGDAIAVTATVWSWADSKGVVHPNMIWPSLDVWVRWFARRFRTVEIVHWPHDPPFPYLHAPRRLLLMTDKRVNGDDGAPARIVVHPPPDVEQPEPEPEPEGGPASADGSGEAAGVAAGHPAGDAVPDVAGQASRTEPVEEAGPAVPEPGPIAPEAPVVAESIPPIEEHDPPFGPRQRPGRPLPGRLVDQPLTYLVGKAKPWDPRFWQRVRRRLPGGSHPT